MTDKGCSTGVKNTSNNQRRRLLLRFVRNKMAVGGIILILIMCLFVLIGPLIWTVSVEKVVDASHQSPSIEHPLGTDENGRDVLARLMYGGKVSILVGVVSAVIAISIGGIIGLLSGYKPGILDGILMRSTDVMISIPIFFLCMIVLATIGPSLQNVILIIGFTTWMQPARVVRGEAIRARSMDFVLAAKALGASDIRIIFKHILPQTVSALLVGATLGIAYAIMVESALSFIGLGVQPPYPSWGNMLQASRSFVWVSPLLAIYPGVTILLTVLGFSALGDGLRDIFDPNAKES